MEFRRVTDDDLPMLHRWLNDPAVVEWWEGTDVSWDAVVTDYGPDGDPTFEHHLALVDGRPIGWIQCYPASAPAAREETEDWFALGVDRNAAGIDYLLSEDADRGKGLGSQMIASFVEQIVFGAHPEFTQACAGPFAANVPSCRALAKAGFRLVGTIGDDAGPCSLMAIDRPTN